MKILLNIFYNYIHHDKIKLNINQNNKIQLYRIQFIYIILSNIILKINYFLSKMKVEKLNMPFILISQHPLIHLGCMISYIAQITIDGFKLFSDIA